MDGENILGIRDDYENIVGANVVANMQYNLPWVLQVTFFFFVRLLFDGVHKTYIPILRTWVLQVTYPT